MSEAHSFMDLVIQREAEYQQQIQRALHECVDAAEDYVKECSAGGFGNRSERRAVLRDAKRRAKKGKP